MKINYILVVSVLINFFFSLLKTAISCNKITIIKKLENNENHIIEITNLNIVY